MTRSMAMAVTTSLMVGPVTTRCVGTRAGTCCMGVVALMC
jgi:hypothetical protein